jgi:hypothetical protein
MSRHFVEFNEGADCVIYVNADQVKFLRSYPKKNTATIHFDKDHVVNVTVDISDIIQRD